MSEAVREMTFDEEYEILQAEKTELFAKENEDAEPPFANCVVRRALRCIRKLKEEVKPLKEKATAKKPIDKSKNPKEWHVMTCPNCEHTFWNSGDFIHYQPKFCNYCGQRLDWS